MEIGKLFWRDLTLAMDEYRNRFPLLLTFLQSEPHKIQIDLLGYESMFLLDHNYYIVGPVLSHAEYNYQDSQKITTPILYFAEKNVFLPVILPKIA